ncbi:PTS-dependent dihydroxyacetone kinase phosphotransferase subunit DhaM [Desemzia sp. RIT804]|uniref:dihydroxyacetone kinase phosphoryl donor subunit DhaM n=1 Tax=Desemzia sp. RIT 804 TaxID=2810209 RepID=UPI0019523CFE|nr:dihydroxyacetone kinase phosphoryl donor subunit DhaM [Desemzia sp. RIT 804]MBM6615469.1 PTS-dependent dihydroxyacetone kinase phosphotransferase subunit DhaM [Desemzia sp. RIT 804]
MGKQIGILLVSHVEEVAKGLTKLLNQVAADVTIIPAGGTEDGEVGTSFDKISAAVEEFEEDTIIAFYDLGSAKMNLEMAVETTDKEITLYDTAFVESAYTAASLLQVDVPLEDIDKQLAELKVK